MKAKEIGALLALSGLALTACKSGENVETQVQNGSETVMEQEISSDKEKNEQESLAQENKNPGSGTDDKEVGESNTSKETEETLNAEKESKESEAKETTEPGMDVHEKNDSESKLPDDYDPRLEEVPSVYGVNPPSADR